METCPSSYKKTWCRHWSRGLEKYEIFHQNSTVVTNRNSRFLWVELQLANLRRMKHESDIRDSMTRLSGETLNQLCANTFDLISSGEYFTRGIAIHAFSFLLCMQEPLSPSSFLAGISKLSPNQPNLEHSQLIDICFHYIILDSESNVLQFAHASVHEFLEARPEFKIHECHGLAAISCLSQVMEGFSASSTGNSDSGNEFYWYGSMYWAQH